MLLFKKFYSNKKKVSYLFYLIGLFLISLVYFTQSRLNILFSFVFSMLIITSVKDLTLKNKLSFLIFIFAIPFLMFNLSENLPNRFANQYKVAEPKDVSTSNFFIKTIAEHKGQMFTGVESQYKSSFIDKVNKEKKFKVFETLEHYDGEKLEYYDGEKLEHYDGEKLEHYDGEKLEHYDGEKLEHYDGEKLEYYDGEKLEHYDGEKNEKTNIWIINRDYGGNIYFIGTDTNGDNKPNEFTPNPELLNLKLANKDNEINYAIYIDQYKYYKEIKRIKKEKEPFYVFSKLYIDTLKIVVSYNTQYVLSKCLKELRIFDSIFSGRVCGWQILYDAFQKRDLIFGNGFFADQVYLKPIEKVASNSFINILFNTGLISLLIFTAVILIFFIKYFKFKNLNHTNIYISTSHYYFIYFIFRSFFEDTLAFVSIDLLLLGVASVLIKHNSQSSNN